LFGGVRSAGQEQEPRNSRGRGPEWGEPDDDDKRKGRVDRSECDKDCGEAESAADQTDNGVHHQRCPRSESHQAATHLIVKRGTLEVKKVSNAGPPSDQLT
jgi:hypothetical protein